MSGFDANGDVLPHVHADTFRPVMERVFVKHSELNRKLAANEKIVSSTEAERLARACPACGHQMTEFKCKLLCECGFFQGCSDF